METNDPAEKLIGQSTSVFAIDLAYKVDVFSHEYALSVRETYLSRVDRVASRYFDLTGKALRPAKLNELREQAIIQAEAEIELLRASSE